MRDAWRLAVIVDDPDALKVAAAYYALPKSARTDIDRIGAVSGVYQGVSEVIDRLTAAGALGHKDPPEELKILINDYCDAVISRAQRKG